MIRKDSHDSHVRIIIMNYIQLERGDSELLNDTLFVKIG